MDRLDLEGPWQGGLVYLPHILRGRKSNLFVCLFLNFWLHLVFAPEPELSLVAVTGGSSLLVVLRLLIAMASLVASPGLEISGSAIWHMGLGAPRHVGSSKTRDQAHVPSLVGGLPATGPPEKSQTNLSPGLEPGGLFLFSFRNLSPLSCCPDHSRSLASGS